MFTAEDFVTLLQACPFVPFRLHLLDGQHVDVLTPEVVSVGRRQAIIGLLDPGAADTIFDRWRLVSYLHVTQIETLKPGTPPGTPPAPPSSSPSPTTAS